MPAYLDPLLVFPAIAVLAAGLASLRWRAQRRIAVACAVLALFSALCILYEIASRAAHANIRVDLLFTMPVVSGSAIVLGFLAFRRAPVVDRVVAAGMTAVGLATFVFFSWTMARTSRNTATLTATFSQAQRLYWEETVRCQGNLVKRFGTLDRRDNPCFGDLTVTSRGPRAYPFTRIIVNDSGDVYLMFSPQPGIEDKADLIEGPSLHLQALEGNPLAGESNASGTTTRVELRALPAGTCEARVTRYGTTSVLSLARKDLPPCQTPAAAPVHFIGAWSAVATPPGSPQTRRLSQIWLWEADGEARALFHGGLATSGTHLAFAFAQQLRGIRRGANDWELRLPDQPEYRDLAPFRFRIVDNRARLSGPSGLLRSPEEVTLEPGEFVSHPKIALAPLGDRARFLAYFDAVFFNLNIPWTAP